MNSKTKPVRQTKKDYDYRRSQKDYDYRRIKTQSEHASINAREYPGTRQLCVSCDAPTHRCEEDAIYNDDGVGPLCEDC